MSAHRKKHTHHQQHPSAKAAPVPSSQRTSGHLLWALLVAVFGLVIGYFAGNGSVPGLVVGAVAGGALGWVLGRKMEQDVAGKSWSVYGQVAGNLQPAKVKSNSQLQDSIQAGSDH